MENNKLEKRQRISLNKELALKNKRKCKFCAEIKDLNSDNFFHNNIKKTSTSFNHDCRICYNLRKRNDEYRKIRNKKSKEYSFKNPRRKLWEGARNRSRINKIPFSITQDDIIIPEFCPIFKIKLKKSNRIARDCSPSLDRIIPELGYIKGNVMVISNKANRLKNSLTHNDLIGILKYIEENDMRNTDYQI